MSVGVGKITIDTAVLDKMATSAKPKARNLVEKYGRLVQASAITRAPYKTGNLRNTIASNSDFVNYMTFRVQDGTEYGIFLELGTSKMAARPFMTPAIEQHRQKFMDAFKELFK